MQFMPLYPRLRCAALMALSGGAVAQAMSLWGGSLARFLPPLALLGLAGAAGAALAGLLLADAFGRKGRWGWLWSVLTWPVATALGAGLGATLLVGASEVVQARRLAFPIHEGAPLGWLAVADGIATSPQVAAIWVVACVAMHCGARIERDALT